MSQKTGKMSIKRIPFGVMLVLANYIFTESGSLFNSYVELTLFSCQTAGDFFAVGARFGLDFFFVERE